ncbi:serine hydrolase domain-containing protein [Stappia sp.]|uniref:serine hydrolase domain-containing protein n=1 Tax=Stappia sp. TaxID=1870903 RepID=UPI003A9910A7
MNMIEAAAGADMARALDAAIDSALAERRIVGCVSLVAERGQVVYRSAAGLADREAGLPMTVDTPFRLASVSKPFTTAAALRLMSDGRLSPDDPVERWLPAFLPKLANGASARITIGHLLAHMAGLDYRFSQPPGGAYAAAGVSDGLDEAGPDLADNLARIASVPLDMEPGTAWRYSVATDVLGAVVEAAAGQPLDEAMETLVTGPLGLGARFHADPATLAVPYFDERPEPRRMDGVVEVPLPEGFGSAVRFDPARIAAPSAFFSGGAGMAGRAGDVLTLLEALRSGAFLDAGWREAARRPRVGAEAMAQGPGWGYSWTGAILLDPVAAGSSLSEGAVSWGGVYGHWWCIDHARERVTVLLTNTAYEGMIGRLAQDVGAAAAMA